MKSFVKSLLSARAELISEFAKVAAQLERRLGHLDALLQENDIDTASLPSVANPGKAAGKKRGRKPGAAKAKDETNAPKAKRGRKVRGKPGFSVTGAVREVVAGMKTPFNIATLRDEFEKRHPGVLATLNRVTLSLAMQSLGRKDEVTTRKDPKGKGNLFFKTEKLKV